MSLVSPEGGLSHRHTVGLVGVQSVMDAVHLLQLLLDCTDLRRRRFLLRVEVRQQPVDHLPTSHAISTLPPRCHHGGGWVCGGGRTHEWGRGACGSTVDPVPNGRACDSNLLLQQGPVAQGVADLMELLRIDDPIALAVDMEEDEAEAARLILRDRWGTHGLLGRRVAGTAEGSAGGPG